ncbi:MAG: branched-chain amino acid ABC transporter permease [Candidatus Eisenbacteria bacterium]|nr:branched-chain amino acid ABC transporter permease [Candidatus Eisenbacteria bacterium]
MSELAPERFLPLPTRLLRFGLGLAVIILLQQFVLPGINPYFARILILAEINVILAVSLNLINGFAGQFSLGHAGFMAIGGYVSAAFAVSAGPAVLAVLGASPEAPGPAPSFIVLCLGLILGALVAAITGLLIGIPTLRLKGDYLAIATLGFGEIIRVVIQNTEAVGGARGFINIPTYAGFFAVTLFMVLTLAVHWNLVHSRHGRALLAVREDEIAAEAMGVPTTRYKVLAFSIGAAFAGVGGSLFAHYNGGLHPNTFTFLKSIEVVIMVVLGGMGSITGSILAALLLTAMPELLRPIKEYRMVIYSLLLIVLMITRPQGIFGLGEFDPARLLWWRRARGAR